MRTTNVVVSASVTRNSAVFTVPIVFFTSWPTASIVDVTTGPQPPPPGGVKKASGETERVNALSDVALLLAFQERLARITTPMMMR